MCCQLPLLPPSDSASILLHQRLLHLQMRGAGRNPPPHKPKEEEDCFCPPESPPHASSSSSSLPRFLLLQTLTQERQKSRLLSAAKGKRECVLAREAEAEQRSSSSRNMKPTVIFVQSVTLRGRGEHAKQSGHLGRVPTGFLFSKVEQEGREKRRGGRGGRITRLKNLTNLPRQTITAVVLGFGGGGGGGGPDYRREGEHTAEERGRGESPFPPLHPRGS